MRWRNSVQWWFYILYHIHPNWVHCYDSEEIDEIGDDGPVPSILARGRRSGQYPLERQGKEKSIINSINNIIIPRVQYTRIYHVGRRDVLSSPLYILGRSNRIAPSTTDCIHSINVCAPWLHMKRGHGLDWIVCGALQCLMLDILALSSCSILLSLFIPNVSYLTSNSLLLFINKISFCSLLIIFVKIRHPT